MFLLHVLIALMASLLLLTLFALLFAVSWSFCVCPSGKCLELVYWFILLFPFSSKNCETFVKLLLKDHVSVWQVLA